MPTSQAGSGRTGSRRPERGFTLLELLVVMTVIALIVAMAAPSLERSLPGARFRNSVADLRSEFQLARLAAIRENRETWVLLDAEARAYRRAGTNAAQVLPDGVSLSFITARSELTAENSGTIRFFPDGSSTGGSVLLASEGRAKTVEIDWFDGRITTNETQPE